MNVFFKLQILYECKKLEIQIYEWVVKNKYFLRGSAHERVIPSLASSSSSGKLLEVPILQCQSSGSRKLLNTETDEIGNSWLLCHAQHWVNIEFGINFWVNIEFDSLVFLIHV